MHHISAQVMLLAATAANNKSFHIGPWIVVPLIFLLAIIVTPVYIVRDRKKRRAAGPDK